MKLARPDTILTCDPGVSNGGFAFWKHGDPVKVFKMPDSLDKISGYFKHAKTTYPETVLFIEALNIHGTDQEQGGKQFRIRKMLDNYAQLKSLAVFVGLPYVEVYPQSWQSLLGLNKNKGLTDTEKKQKFKAYAQLNWQEVSVTNWSADALNILDFALTKYSTDPDWIADRIKRTETGQIDFN